MSTFEDTEIKKLNALVDTFTPQESKKYGEEVRYIRYLLTLLKKEKAKPQTKKVKEDEKETKQKVQKSLENLLKTYSIKKPTDKTMDSLPEDVIEDAKLAKVSTNYYKDKNAGQQYLEQSGLADKYEIDNQLSNEKGIVVVDKKTGKVKVAYRGTDKSNLNDLEADARIAVGSEASHNHFTDAREQMKATIDKYGFDNVERVVGYSLGGTKSYTMGKAFKIPSRSFNPFIAGNNLTDGENFNSEEHEIFRTQDDIASFAAPRIEGRNNTSLNVVEALHGTVNPYKTHKLENFTTNTGRTGDKTSVIESKSRDIVEHSLEHGELKTLHDMIKVNKRTGLKITEVSSKTPITSKSTIGLMPPPASTETRTENPLFEKPTRIETQNPLFEPPKRLSTVDKSFQDLLQQQELIQKDKASQKQAILESDAKILSTKKPSISVDENGNLDTSTKPKVFKRSFKSSVRRKTMAPNTEIELKTLRGATDFTENNSKINRLKNQTDILENQIENLTNTDINNKPNIKKKSFTEYVNENNISPTDHKKVLWQKSGGVLTDEESTNFDENTETFNTDSDINDFTNNSTTERETQLKEKAAQQLTLENDLNNFVEAPVHISAAKTIPSEIGRGLHPTNLLLGLATDAAAGGIIKQYIEPITGKQSQVAELGERGALAGGLSAFLTGGAMLPEVAAGVAGYETGAFTAEKVFSGLKSVGAGDQTALASADVAGGLVGGASAAYVGGAVAGLGALAVGAEEGATLGSVLAPGVGTAIGAGLGAIVGLGGYFYSRFRH